MERQAVKDGSNPCIYRLSQEGLPFLLPHITKQRLRLPLSEFVTLLTARAMRIPKGVPYATFRAPSQPDATDTTATDGATQADTGVAAGAQDPPDTAADAAAAAAAEPKASSAPARPNGGFAATANGQETPLLDAASTQEQLAGICAGCCVATLMCATAALRLAFSTSAWLRRMQAAQMQDTKRLGCLICTFLAASTMSRKRSRDRGGLHGRCWT